ncbi:MAG TPA: WYL domain-containing protein [Marmoricola sp.]|nr:WYL domain-containing protein [Marmoricola sp.]
MATARDQLTRMLALVPYLQRGQDISLKQLADEFHVRPAEIVKDLKILWMCGLPGLSGGSLMEIDFEAFENDPDGVVRLQNADYLTRPMRLDSTQAAALVVALRTLRDSSTGDIIEIINRVLAKLDKATDEAGPIAATETPDSGRSAHDAQIRAQLSSAIAGNRQVDIAYYVPARDEMTTRRVEPQTLLERDGHSYLDAWCHAAEAQRLFRIDRIDTVTIREDVRSRPTSDQVLDDALFVASESHTLATIHVTPRGRWAADYYPVESTTEASDGGLDITMRIADRNWLFRTLLSMAPQGTLIAPADWADEFRGYLASIHSLYSGGAQ